MQHHPVAPTGERSEVVHMRWLVVILLAGASAAARTEGISEVLVRSQQVRIDAHSEVDASAPAAQKIRDSFQTVLRGAGPVPPVELRVVSGAGLAETLQGRVIVVNESLADATEGERLFVLAHELGHVALKHWPEMTNLYQAWIPGEVVRAQTDPIASLLGYDASRMSYRQEFEADGFALRTLQALGRSPQDAFQALMQQGVHGDTATHPGTFKRVASLKHALAEEPAASR
jgi:Zn-dependent protease with chaperone function